MLPEAVLWLRAVSVGCPPALAACAAPARGRCDAQHHDRAYFTAARLRTRAALWRAASSAGSLWQQPRLAAAREGRASWPG